MVINIKMKWNDCKEKELYDEIKKRRQQTIGGFGRDLGVEEHLNGVEDELLLFEVDLEEAVGEEDEVDVEGFDLDGFGALEEVDKERRVAEGLLDLCRAREQQVVAVDDVQVLVALDEERPESRDRRVDHDVHRLVLGNRVVQNLRQRVVLALLHHTPQQ